MSVLAYIGFGSNLGDCVALCREAARRLLELPQVELCGASSLYETQPVGFVGGQPPCVNGVLAIRTLLDPDTLLEALLDIEALMGRTREQPKGPRLIDLDLLIYGDLVHAAPGLVVPHPLLAERRFVLVPLLEIAPELCHPATFEPLASLLERAPEAWVRRLPFDLRGLA